MVSLLTALSDNVFLSFMLTSSFISTVSLQLHFFEHTAYILEHDLSLPALYPDIRIPAKIRNPLGVLVSTASLKPSSFLVLQDYFCLGRSVYCLTAIFKDISEKALVIIPSHKHRFNAKYPCTVNNIHYCISGSLALKIFRWLAINWTYDMILWEKLLNFLFLGAAVLSFFLSKEAIHLHKQNHPFK